MPRLAGVTERCDKVLFDTHTVESNSEVRFFELREDSRPTTKKSFSIFDQSYVLISIGLRVLDAIEETPILDRLIVTPIIGDKPYGPYPGALCSIFIDDKTKLQDFAEKELCKNDPQGRECGKKNPIGFAIVPGYALLRPLVIPVRQSFYAEVQSGELPRAIELQVMFFGLLVRDVC